MKELSIEEKAKAYDNIIEKANKMHSENCEACQMCIEELISELKESEDERVRKGIISLIEFALENNSAIVPGENITKEEALAWLEKQGEQKPVEHLELKAGHWYICHHPYCCRADDLTVKEGERFMCEKDGIAKGFEIKEPEKYFKEVCPPAPMEDEQKPAECRQETKPNGGIVSEDFNEGDGYYKVNLAYLSKSQVELIENLVTSWQNSANNISAWSDEDERIRQDIENLIHFALKDGSAVSPAANTTKEDAISWIQSLKGRVQPKQEWSEEDKKLINDTCHLINTLASGYGEKATEPISFAGVQQVNSIKTRLRALVDSRPQSQWKPSDEQVNNK